MSSAIVMGGFTLIVVIGFIVCYKEFTKGIGIA